MSGDYEFLTRLYGLSGAAGNMLTSNYSQSNVYQHTQEDTAASGARLRVPN